ncbi:transcriptional regulator domain-containing protein [Caulobacter sp. UNC358MFTsu5.1]|uniref:transcriptional regulator domain-containing protein n=1 Tax=Caulobacter sp. UNC358MFTsu5.1 TaxID=1449049 RepID=UPI0009E07ED6|nr:DUF6499 domain-containing protein [Caulobacter sp. UNC358MFTsu5.1]
MSPDASSWRSAEAYDYLDDLPAADLAWEYLRRNPDYQRDFQATRSEDEDGDGVARWGLRFPGRSFA